MTLWPFMPIGTVTENIEWRTEVIEAKSSEQRIRTRRRPRRTWELSHFFTEEQYTAARAIVRSASEYLVPDWSDHVHVGAVSAGTSVNIPIGNKAVLPGDFVVIIDKDNNWEVCSVSAVGGGNVTLASVANSWTGVVVWQVDKAHAATKLDVTRGAGGVINARISFESYFFLEQGATDRPQYRDADIINDDPVVGGGTASFGIAAQFETIDNEIGLFAHLRERKVTPERVQLSWTFFQSQKKLWLRQWVLSQRGKIGSFWYASGEKNLRAAETLISSSTNLRVFLPYGAKSLGETTFDIEIRGLQTYRRRVLSVTNAGKVNNIDTVYLQLETALGTGHLQSQLQNISFLRRYRFDSDRIEIQHLLGGGMSITMSCVEVPL